MNKQHTPTPYQVATGMPGSSSGLTIRDENGNIIARVGSIEDAAFIVRACNAHDELVSACRLAMRRCEGNNDEEHDPELYNVLLAALAKAGAA